MNPPALTLAFRFSQFYLPEADYQIWSGAEADQSRTFNFAREALTTPCCRGSGGADKPAVYFSGGLETAGGALVLPDSPGNSPSRVRMGCNGISRIFGTR